MKTIVRFIGLLLGLLLSGCLMTRNEVDQVEQKKVMQDQVVHLQKSTAEQQSKFVEVNDELRHATGKMETLENRLDQQEKNREKVQALQDQQLAETNKKVALLQEEVVRLEGRMNELVQSLSAKANDASDAKKSGASIYAQAEDAFMKKDWKRAIVNYQKFRDQHPTSKKFPEATYKIGVSFQELGMKDEAKAFFDEVLTKFPQSAVAKSAKARLKKVK